MDGSIPHRKLYEPENKDYDSYLFYSSVRITLFMLLPIGWLIFFLIFRYGIGYCGGRKSEFDPDVYKSNWARYFGVGFTSFGGLLILIGGIMILIGTISIL